MHTLARIVILAVSACCAQATELAQLTRPDTNFLLGVRVSEIRESPLFALMFEQMGMKDLDLVGLPEGKAVDLLDHVDEVLVAGRVDASGESAEDEAVILVRGDFAKFDLARELCREGCDVESHREVGLYKSHRATPEDESPDYLSVLGERYVALGKRTAVTDVIDRYVWQSPPNHAEELAAWQERLGTSDMWLLANGPFTGAVLNEAGPAAVAAGSLDSVRALGFGLDLGEALEAALEIRVGTNKEARELFENLEALVALLGMAEAGNADSNGQVAAMKTFVDALAIENEGHKVTARLSVPEGDIRRALSGETAQPAAQPSIAGGGGVRQSGRNSQIRIFGLETGTHAVETKQTRRQR